jgi:tetratricopeptide (TPR) repeat protein
LVLHVDGDVGVGKSRLVDEYLVALRGHGANVLEGACVPYGEANIWYPLASALPEVFDELGDNPDLDAVRGIVGDVLELRSQRGPVVLSIDDLQWADPLLVEVLDTVSRRLSRLPFTVVTAMRPGSDVDWPRTHERSTVVALTLLPLSADESAALAAELLGDDADEATLTSLHDRSGGNPLFLVELAALGKVDGPLPGSLRALISARLDQLTPEQRRVIENAAVLGTSGTLASLHRFADALRQPSPTTAISELDELGLLVVRGQRWEFDNEAVRDVAYQTLTKAARAVRHAGVATSLKARHAPLDDLAHHAATAAELQQELGDVEGLPPFVRDHAINLLTEAAGKALTGGSLRMATRHTSRAIDLLGNDRPIELAQLLTVRGNAAVEQRDFRAGGRDIDALTQLGQRLGDATITAEAHRMRGMMANAAGRIDDARSELGQAIALLRDTDRRDLLANSLRQRGFIEMFVGSLTDAEWFFGEADQIFHDLDDERGMAYIEQHRAWLSFNAAEYDEARSRLQHAATTLERLGDRGGVGWANGLLAFIEFFEGNFERAAELADIVTRAADARSDQWAVAMMDTLRANLALWQGRLDDAVTAAERARNRMRRLDDRFGLVQSLVPLMRAQVALGRNAAAQRTSEEVLALAAGGRQDLFPVLAAAGAAMHRGALTGALDISEQAIHRARQLGMNMSEPVVVLAMLQAQAGRADEALATITGLDEHSLRQPFAAAVSALVHTVNHLPEQALQSTVAGVNGASYLDHVIASVAAAGAHAQLGHLADAEAAANGAVASATSVGDVPATALATATYALVTGRRHTAHDDRATLGEGWANVLSMLR